MIKIIESSKIYHIQIQSVISISDAQEYAKDIGAIFCETSAMTAVNVAELFDAIGL